MGARLPDIIFLDIRMPEMEGTEVVQRIFEEYGRGCTKLVAISASVFKHEQQSYLDAGFDAFVGKPFRFEEICQVLERLLNVEFEYVGQETKPVDGTVMLDPTTLRLPSARLTQLQEAAARYSVTRLEQGLRQLEGDGETGFKVAAYLRQVLQNGDLEGVTAFLAKVNHDA
jgi:DNA-binding response OmpR family regulator